MSMNLKNPENINIDAVSGNPAGGKHPGTGDAGIGVPGGKPRDYLFDNIKALLAISMVLVHYIRVSGHCGAGSVSRFLYVTVFFFLMQSFFFISGYFSHNHDKCRKTAFHKFIVPYIVFMPLMFIARYILWGSAHLRYLHPSHGLWFLLVLFAYRFFIKDLSRVPQILPISLIAYFAAGLIPALGTTLALGRTVSFLFFFMLGYYCNAETIEKIRKTPARAAWLTLAGALAVSAVCAARNYTDYKPLELQQIKDDGYYYGLETGEILISRVVILVMALAFMYVLIRLVPRHRTILTEVGQNTMTVFLLHIFVRYAVKRYGIPGYPGPVYWEMLIALTAVSVYLFSRPAVSRAYNKAMDFVYYGIFAPVFNQVKPVINETLHDGRNALADLYRLYGQKINMTYHRVHKLPQR